MRLTRIPLLIGAFLLGMAGIAGFLYVQSLWSGAASYTDAHLRQKGEIRLEVPPPGPLYLEPDSYYWLSYAQRIAQGEDWRIRYTHADNFPEGREVHWSQVISWSMVCFGRVRAIFSHEQLRTAIEKASVAINPLLFAIAASGLLLALSRRFGVLPSAIFIAVLSGLPDTAWIFQALRPDHQGYHLVLGGISVVAPLIGGLGFVTGESDAHREWRVFQQPEPTSRRAAFWWFLAGGIGAGLGLWVSALVECFFIYPFMGIYVVLALGVSSERLAGERLQPAPNLWRVWGWSAGGTSFLFYLIEYFPHHLAMRLEVNHPIYSIAAVAAGEAMASISQLRWRPEGPRTPGKFVVAGLALVVAAVPALLVAKGPSAWHHMRDPQMWRMAEGVEEFRPFTDLVKTHRALSFLAAYGVLPFFGALTPLILRSTKLSVIKETWLWLTLAFASFFMAAGLWQSRWMGFGGAAMCLGAMVSAHHLWGCLAGGGPSLKIVGAGVVSAVLLVQPAFFLSRPIHSLRKDLRGESLEDAFVIPMLLKRTACALKAAPGKPEAIMNAPDLAPALVYFSEIPVVSSLYWENLEGLRKATRFFTATSSDEALKVVAQTGVTHIMIPTNESVARFFCHIAFGIYSPAQRENSIANQLLEKQGVPQILPDTELSFLTFKDYVYLGSPLSESVETFRVER